MPFIAPFVFFFHPKFPVSLSFYLSHPFLHHVSPPLLFSFSIPIFLFSFPSFFHSLSLSDSISLSTPPFHSLTPPSPPWLCPQEPLVSLPPCGAWRRCGPTSARSRPCARASPTKPTPSWRATTSCNARAADATPPAPPFACWRVWGAWLKVWLTNATPHTSLKTSSVTTFEVFPLADMDKHYHK